MKPEISPEVKAKLATMFAHTCALVELSTDGTLDIDQMQERIIALDCMVSGVYRQSMDDYIAFNRKQVRPPPAPKLGLSLADLGL